MTLFVPTNPGSVTRLSSLHDAGNPNVVDTAVSLIQSKTSVLEDFGGSLDVAIGWFHGKTRWDKE